MREIKFRAWDKRRSWMLYDDESCGYVDMESHEVDVVNFILSGDYNKNLTFMQYTGLKDKNGREIYEGDIVHHLEPNYDKLGGLIDYNDEYFVVKWNDTVCGFDLMLDVYTMPSVIGNIYENPELLEV